MLRRPTSATTAASAFKRPSLSELYSSDFAYWAALLVLWEVLVLLIALWLVPLVLSAAAESGALLPAAAIVGAGA
jgi:hypothetical protein